MKIVPVVLAGGVGERFWPLSRSTRPKQLLPILSTRPMIVDTILRAKPFLRSGVRPLIVTSKSISVPLRKAIPSGMKYDCIVEPVGKNTAPAIAAAAVWIKRNYGDAVMLVLPSDHSVIPAREFVSAVRFAAETAESQKSLCVFGIRPSRPDTGYGYIQTDKKLYSKGSLHSANVLRFVEKPTEAIAKDYCASGRHFWNSGMFVWTASGILREFEIHMPELYRQAVALESGKLTVGRLNRFYLACKKESIDYGVMEKSEKVVMINATFSWDDVGSWESLPRIAGINASRNTIKGSRVFNSSCEDSIIMNTSKMTISACGLKNMVVVATDDAVLVIPRDKLPDIRRFISEMKSDGRLPGSIF